MENLKLTIEMLPKGAWNNDFSKTLPKKEWDIVRNACYKKANHRCQICGYKTDDLDAHEVWEFDIKKKTQTLKDIIGICSKCHGVKHIRNSQRLGYGEDSKRHFMSVNNCSDLDYASHLTQAQMDFEERNKIYRWKLVADISKFGLNNATIKERNIPFIKSPYQDVDWNDYNFIKYNKNKIFIIEKNSLYFSEPKVLLITIDNYQGIIEVLCDNINKIEWYLDKQKIKTKYNVVGKFKTSLNVENLNGKELTFTLFGDGGKTFSKTFELLPQEVL
ncbi:MAG: HNH endonuclease [Clostridia bacterium]|nr:HNH endonuclease [Clostridia bacterium]